MQITSSHHLHYITSNSPDPWSSSPQPSPSAGRSDDVFLGGQMMYDPLTAQRIHPHACSYIPHLSNPSRGEVLLIQHQFLEHPYFVQTETQSRSIKLTPIYNLAFTLDNNSYLMHMQLTHQANKYIQAIFSFWPIQVYPALYTTYGIGLSTVYLLSVQNTWCRLFTSFWIDWDGVHGDQN